MRKLLFGAEARQALANGINSVARAVACTLGPRGRTVLIGKAAGPGIVTKDGVTVARSIKLEDPFENEGAKLCIEVATRSNMDAGDGTTTATVLAQAMVNAGLRHIQQGSNPVKIVKGINQAVSETVSYIQSQAIEVTEPAQIEYVATISGNDSEIGKTIADAIDQVGKDGVITIEPGNFKTSTEIVDGYQFDKGYVSPYFANNQKMEAVYEDCLVLVALEKFRLAQQAAQVLEQCVNQKKPLLLICEEVDGDALVTFVMNRTQGSLPIVVVTAPHHGERQKETLDDIAAFCGAKFICPEQGYDPDDLNPEMLGSCKKIIVSPDSTTIFEGNGDVLPRVEQLRELANTGSPTDRLRYQERLAKLTQGLAIIRIGASTDVELIEKKHRYEDALNATRAAVAEGIVAGGGFTLMQASKVICIPADRDEAVGAKLVRDALLSPMRQIAVNAGFDGDAVVEEGTGFDAAAGKHCDLVKEGIVDPAKVTRTAVQNAASIAAYALTTECLNVELPREEKNGK